MSNSARAPANQWTLAVDTGGTFTDCLAQTPGGDSHYIKVLSSSALRGRVAEVVTATGEPRVHRIRIEAAWQGPDQLVRGFRFQLLPSEPSVRSGLVAHVLDYRAAGPLLTLDRPPAGALKPGTSFELLSPEPAPLLAARLATGTVADAPLPALTMRLATTRATNALLTRRGSPPVFLTTRGFGDLLDIGTQARPDLFQLAVRKAEPLYATVREIPGRLDATGREIETLDDRAVATTAAELAAAGYRVAAVALLHADKNPHHEQRVAAHLRQAGFTHVSCSAELAGSIRILPRAETAVVDAYLRPVMDAYLQRIAERLAEKKLFVMTSAGGLTAAHAYRAKDCLLSGPAGGIAGAALVGRRTGYRRLISFDMGGTSTDVSRYDGDFDYVFEHSVGDAHLIAPALAIETVAAGGGSICSGDRTGLKVGPASAGASPGPASYGAGGPLTLTDVNLLLGRIDPQRFDIPIQIRAAERAFADVRRALPAAGESEELLEGFVDIANQRMADAIRRISLRRGYDPADYALVAFGGAGGQHALAVAAGLGIETVLVPPHPGLLSAIGLAAAVVERFAETQILRPLQEWQGALAAALDQLARRAIRLVRCELGEGGPVGPGGAAGEIKIRRRIASLRCSGQEATLDVDMPAAGAPAVSALESAFGELYRGTYGHPPEDRPVELVSLRVVASTLAPPAVAPEAEQTTHAVRPASRTRTRFAGSWRDTAVYDRETLASGARLAGPALIFERHSAVVIDPGWRVDVHASGTMVITRAGGPRGGARGRGSPRPEVVRRELFTHRFESIAREMGAALQRTAVSTNVKERLDFSCALLDADGELVVNAPHIPVHLGSMGLCVRAVVRALPLAPGDTAVTNHPAYGGSHLPDVTLITPVDDAAGSRIGYVASRAHHAEFGGSQPGSMPPTATRLFEEGVVLSPMRLVRAGRADWEALTARLTGGPHPTRALADNLADLRAALAANQSGAVALRRLADRHGSSTVAHYMNALKLFAEERIRETLRRYPDGRFAAREVLDDGTCLQMLVTIAGDRAIFDFSGSDGVHPGNLNATPAVVRSVILYVLRLIINEPLPLNEGLLRAIDVHIPRGILDPPFGDDPATAPAVMGGNVETSQRLVNGLLRALGLAAASQGTMNNLTFGDSTFSYYETICGGCGAGPGFAGADAVHSHMTNTRITDPELIEHRYPVRIERFALRRGSGGAGAYPGGDGVVRAIRFLAPLSLALLTQHRDRGPAGLAGGGPGKPGEQRLTTRSGTRLLGAVDSCRVAAGDLLVIKTPGGGGYGVAGREFSLCDPHPRP